MVPIAVRGEWLTIVFDDGGIGMHRTSPVNRRQKLVGVQLGILAAGEFVMGAIPARLYGGLVPRVATP